MLLGVIMADGESQAIRGHQPSEEDRQEQGATGCSQICLTLVQKLGAAMIKSSTAAFSRYISVQFSMQSFVRVYLHIYHTIQISSPATKASALSPSMLKTWSLLILPTVEICVDNRYLREGGVILGDSLYRRLSRVIGCPAAYDCRSMNCDVPAKYSG